MLPTHRITEHLGVFLGEELEARAWTHAQFASMIGSTPSYIRRIISGRSGLTAMDAIRIADALGTSPDLWWNLQCNHDLSTALNACRRNQ